MLFIQFFLYTDSFLHFSFIYNYFTIIQSYIKMIKVKYKMIRKIDINSDEFKEELEKTKEFTNGVLK